MSSASANTVGPRRVQLSRRKGARIPPNTVSVARPGKWGNPYTPEKYWDAGWPGTHEVAIQHCVEAFAAWLEGRGHWAHPMPVPPPPDLAPLRGKNLACWCAIGAPCHADVLLRIANDAGTTPMRASPLPFAPESTVASVDAGSVEHMKRAP